MLWSTEDPSIPSGTVLPVYIKSNIDQVWVAGVPEAFRTGKDGGTKIEIPLALLKFAGSKRKAGQEALAFARYAPVYAENLQDGLPVRDDPDNNARRVYRLRTGELMKILDIAEGSPAISTTGEPLPGEWYKVLTQDGTVGYCFSYRLKVFEHYDGPLQALPVTRKEPALDHDLDMVFARTWSPESYLQMVNSRQINISEFEKRWRFDPGQDTGRARIFLPDMEKEFAYESIHPEGERAWRFEGTNLQMSLRSNTTLAVRFTEDAGAMRTLLFVALSADVDDLIMQENTRREGQFAAIVAMGPKFTSNNYGTITFSLPNYFAWTGFDLLVPQLIPGEAPGNGRVFMDLFLTPSFEDRFNGACTFRFLDVPASVSRARFMYSLDNQGLRLEVVPDYAIEESIVTRRSSSPMVLYFYKDESP